MNLGRAVARFLAHGLRCFTAGVGVVSAVLTASCTTRETESIDLALSAAPPMPKPPKAMPPTMMCASDVDCPEAGKSRCEPSSGGCVECMADGDCTDDPMRPFCEVPHHHCVDCPPDSGCPKGDKCLMDPMCRPAP